MANALLIGLFSHSLDSTDQEPQPAYVQGPWPLSSPPFSWLKLFLSPPFGRSTMDLFQRTPRTTLVGAKGSSYFRLETKISGRGSVCVTPSRWLPHTQHRSSSHPRHQLHVGHCQIFTTPLS